MYRDRLWAMTRLLSGAMLCGLTISAVAQSSSETIPLTRAIPAGKAPGMQWKLLREDAGGREYVVVFHKGDEALSGLTDFAIANKIAAARFTAIGAVASATLGWLDLVKKAYRPILVASQAEVVSLIGDVAAFNGKPVVHMHAVLGRRDGSTAGGHVWELNVNPTLEVFLTAYATPLQKKPDEASGMKLIDPAQ